MSHNHCLFYILWRYFGFGCSITTGTEFISTSEIRSFVISNTSTGTTAVFFFLFLILLIKQQKQQIQPNRCAAQNSGSVSPNVSNTHSYSQKSLQLRFSRFDSFSLFLTVSLWGSHMRLLFTHIKVTHFTCKIIRKRVTVTRLPLYEQAGH